MTLSTLALILTAAGAACELVGLAIVVREIAEDRRRGRRMLARLDAPDRPHRTYPAPMSPARPTWANPAFASSMQLKELTKDFVRMQGAVAKAMVDLKKITDAELDRALEGVQADLAERDRELRDGLRYVLAGSTRDRAVGAVLLGAGILLGAAGSVLSTVSS